MHGFMFKLHDKNNIAHIYNALQLTKHFRISYIILTTMLGRYYYPHFIDKEIEAQRDWMFYPRS